MPGSPSRDDRDRGAEERWPAKMVGWRRRAARQTRGMTLDDAPTVALFFGMPGEY